jgi:hypothetical protein
MFLAVAVIADPPKAASLSLENAAVSSAVHGIPFFV